MYVSGSALPMLVQLWQRDKETLRIGKATWDAYRDMAISRWEVENGYTEAPWLHGFLAKLGVPPGMVDTDKAELAMHIGGGMKLKKLFFEIVAGHAKLTIERSDPQVRKLRPSRVATHIRQHHTHDHTHHPPHTPTNTITIRPRPLFSGLPPTLCAPLVLRLRCLPP